MEIGSGDEDPGGHNQSASRFRDALEQQKLWLNSDSTVLAVRQEKEIGSGDEDPGGHNQSASRFRDASEQQKLLLNSDSTVWADRQKKREGAVSLVKATPLYLATLDVRLLVGDEGAPQTPTPSDRRLSKRDWETGVHVWKESMRNFCENHS